MPERVYQLKFKAPLHVGTLGIGREGTLDYIPSDTLFSALVEGAVAYTGEPPIFLPEAEGPSPLLLSSAFPFAGPVRFFPRPAHLPALPKIEREQIMKPKDIKKVRWVSEGVFHSLRAGRIPQGEMNKEHNLIAGGSAWLTREERRHIAEAMGIASYAAPSALPRLWATDIVPRVAVDRETNASNLFHSGRISFATGCGLWFAARGPDDLLDALKPLVDSLGDAGLGGLRAIGHGAFECEPWEGATPLPEPAEGDAYFITLSRLAPAPDEVDALADEGAAFSLVTVGGWCRDDSGHPWRRKRVRLLAEGARLPWRRRAPGRVVDVTPEGPQEPAPFNNSRRVWRYGMAFPVAAGREGGEG